MYEEHKEDMCTVHCARAKRNKTPHVMCLGDMLLLATLQTPNRVVLYFIRD
jgi:hypothetical protein